MNATLDDFWTDADIIHTYTRGQAVADGILIPLGTLGENISGMGSELGIRVPVYLTNTLYTRINKRGADIAGRIWDVLWMYSVRAYGGLQMQKIGQNRYSMSRGSAEPERITEFSVLVGRRRLRLWGVMDGDALTIMFPEDY